MLVQKILKKFLGDYVEDLDKQQLNISIYQGEVDLTDLKLRPNICDKLGLPISLVFGRIRKLFLKVPWNALSSQPVQLEISGLDLLINPLEKGKWQALIESQNKFEVVEKQVIGHAISVLKKLMEERKQKGAEQQSAEADGYLSKLMTRIVDNVQVTIKQIHVRYEDTLFQRHPLAMGVTLRTLSVHTTNQNWLREFFDRTQAENKDLALQKIIDLCSIGFYCRPRDSKERMISLVGGGIKPDMPAPKVAQLRTKQLKAFEGLMQAEDNMCPGYEEYYLLKPITLKAKFKQLSKSQLVRENAPPFSVDVEVDSFHIEFMKSQFEAVLKVVETFTEFQKCADEFDIKKRIKIQHIYKFPEVFKKSQRMLMVGLLKMITKEVNVLAYDGRQVPKPKMAQFQRESILGPQAKEAYQNFIACENIVLLKSWTSKVVEDNYDALKSILEERLKEVESEEQAEGSGVVAYIGSWLGSALGGGPATSSQPAIESTPPEDTDGVDEAQRSVVERASSVFFSEVSDDIASMSQVNRQILRDHGQNGNKVPLAEAKLSLKEFKLSLVNDSHSRKTSQSTGGWGLFGGKPADAAESEDEDDNPFQEYEHQEVMLHLTDLRLLHRHFDDEDIENQNQGEMQVAVADLGISLILKYEGLPEEQQLFKQTKSVVRTDQHKIIWKKAGQEGEDLVALKLTMANKRLKQLLSKRPEDLKKFVDTDLAVTVLGVHFEYRKEYVEFFMAFFESKEEVADEVYLKAQEELEKLQKAVSIHRLLEQNSKVESRGFQVRISVEDVTAFFPIYNSVVNEQEFPDERVSAVQLLDCTRRSSWIVSTGDVIFHNGPNPACPEGMSSLTLGLSPKLSFAENVADWWKKEEALTMLERTKLGYLILVKNKDFKFDRPTEEVSELTMKFSVEHGHLRLEPLTYMHLINIVDCFSRPLASSGDAEKLKQNERRHIFKNARRISIVRKKGQYIRAWYDQIAVLSGSFIYFYPVSESKQIFQILRFFKKTDLLGEQFDEGQEGGGGVLGNLLGRWRQPAVGKQPKLKARDFKDLHYEEYFTLKGCNRAEEVGGGKGEEPLRRATTSVEARSSSSTQLRLVNYKGTECFLQLSDSEDLSLWKDLIEEKAREIDVFLCRDKFKFGDFGTITADKVQSLKLEEIILQEQLDLKNNFDHLIKDDPNQLQQTYEATIDSLAVTITGLSKFALKSSTISPTIPDQVCLSSKIPPQLNREMDSVEHDSFHFALFAQKFFFGFYYKEFDKDMIFSLQSLKGFDRTPRQLHIEHQIEQQGDLVALDEFNPAFDSYFRYQNIVRSEPSPHQENLVKAVISFIDVKSANYQGIEVNVDVSVSRVHVNWQPVTLNRMIRFFRFMKYPSAELFVRIARGQEIKFFRRRQEKKEPAASAKNQSLVKSTTLRLGQERRKKMISNFLNLDKTFKRQSCDTDPTVPVAVNVAIDRFKLVCIHPHNTSYPVMTVLAEKFKLGYKMHQDHDSFEGALHNFVLYDNTMNPQTLDPIQTYPAKTPTQKQIIFQFKKAKSEQALDFEITSFHFPTEVSCPRQMAGANKQFKSLVRMTVRAIEIKYQQETFFRIQDYFFGQFMESLSDSQPFQEVIHTMVKVIDPAWAKKKEQNSPQIAKQEEELNKKLNQLMEQLLKSEEQGPALRRLGHVQRSSVKKPFEDQDDDFLSEDLDEDDDFIDTDESVAPTSHEEPAGLALQQDAQVAGLDIKILNPKVILKDRPYLDKFIEIDLGLVHITNSTQRVQGRWLLHKERYAWTNTTSISLSKICLSFCRQENMTQAFDLTVDIDRLNYSPQLLDRFLSPGFDFGDLRLEDSIMIRSPHVLQLIFRQPTYTFLLRCLDLNINYVDRQEACFQFATWNSYNTQRQYLVQEQIRERYRDSAVRKRTIEVRLPVLGIQMLNEPQGKMVPPTVLGELSLTSLKMVYKQFLDGRSKMELSASEMFILQPDEEAENPQETRVLLLGPLHQAKAVDIAALYEDLLKQKAAPSSLPPGFKMEMDQTPLGERKMQVSLKNLKLFLQMDALYLLQAFFQEGMPNYDNDNEKPVGYDRDPANYPTQDYTFSLEDCIVCFEQWQISKRTKMLSSVQLQASRSVEASSNRTMEDEPEPLEDYFTRTVAFKGAVQLKFVRTRPNDVKKTLLEANRPDDSADQIDSSQINTRNKCNKSEEADDDGLSLPIRHFSIEVVGLQPFFCEIHELKQAFPINYEEPMKHLNKRQLISPFGVTILQEVKIKLNPKETKALAKAIAKTAFSKLSEKERARLQEEDNFQVFEDRLTKIGLAEVHVSFQDMIVLKGISQKWSIMAAEYEERVKRHRDRVSADILRLEGEAIMDDSFEFTDSDESEEANDTSSEQDAGATFNGDLMGHYQVKRKTTSQFLQGMDNQAQSSMNQLCAPGKKGSGFIAIGSSSGRPSIKEDCEFSDSDDESSVGPQINKSRPSNISLNQLQQSLQSKSPEKKHVPPEIINRVSSPPIERKVLQKGKRPATRHASMIIPKKTKPNEKDEHITLKQKYYADFKTRPSKQRGTDGVELLTNGLKVILINDKDSNFLPIISLNTSPFSIDWKHDAQGRVVLGMVKASMNYFNVRIGRWEPFFEKFDMRIVGRVELDQKAEHIEICLPSLLNINITEKLVENLYESKKSWTQCNEEYSEFERAQKLEESEASSASSRDNEGGDPFLLDQRMSVVDARLRNKLMKPLPETIREDDSQKKLEGLHSKSPGDMARNPANTKVVLPYAIVNRTDLQIVVRRLIKRDQAVEKTKSMIVEPLEPEQSAETIVKKKRHLTNVYRVPQGQIVDYMVDYNDDTYQGGLAVKATNTLGEKAAEGEDRIHFDHVGEYKSEHIRVMFDKTSAEIGYNAEQLEENREIKQVDLSELGYRTHELREGSFSEEVFYGCKIIDSKKVFTVRSKFQIVNFTGYDYLVFFKFPTGGLLKFLESGDSLPLSRRFDDAKIQIKIIDEDILEETGGKGPFEEEAVADKVANMRDEQFKNWSALIPIKILKERLKMEESSFLKGGTSKYTFIRKTKSDILSKEAAIDINLMPPLIVKNCLPVPFKLHFYDSSNVLTTVKFEKEEEKNLFCFSMAQSAIVDLIIEGFETVENFKLFNLEHYHTLEDKIEIKDRYGRHTMVYTQLQRKSAGQRVIFYSRKMVIDSIDSDLRFFYKQPTLLGDKEKEKIENMVPFVSLPLIKQKIYILPDEGELEQLFTSLASNYERKECHPVDVQTTKTQFELTLNNKESRQAYCYYTNVFLATQGEYLYTKITTVSPYYIICNESKSAISIEQADTSAAGLAPQPLKLDPGKRAAFHFRKFQQKSAEEYLHIRSMERCLEQEEPAKLPKVSTTYSWSTPFQVNNVSQFTLRLKAAPLADAEAKKITAVKDKAGKDALTAFSKQDCYLRVQCKTDLGDNMGSMFVVVRDEGEAVPEYQVVNESKKVDLLFSQHTTKLNLKLKSLEEALKQNVERRLKQGEATRYAWASVLHDKLLKVAFSPKGSDKDRLIFKNLTDKQGFRVAPDSKKAALLIPIEKIGHSEELTLIKEPSKDVVARVLISISTNGFTKFLKVTDLVGTKLKKETKLEAGTKKFKHLTFNPFTGPADFYDGIAQKVFDFSLKRVCFSLIHRKREVMTLFAANANVRVEETVDITKAMLNVGYLQIDNQSEAEPAMAVMIRPRNLHYHRDTQKIDFFIESETDEEREEREKSGLDNLTEDTAKMLQSELVINKSETSKNHEVVYFETIMFLLQTLEIKVQFSHFLKVSSFLYNVGKALNHRVTQVHYVFEADETYTWIQQEAQKQGEDLTLIDFHLNLKKKNKERMRNVAKQDILLGSKVKHVSSQAKAARAQNAVESNWQFSSKITTESNWRVFIKTYQSSPLELMVSALNERLDKDKQFQESHAAHECHDHSGCTIKDHQQQQSKEVTQNAQRKEVENHRLLVQNGLIEYDENLASNDSEIIGLIGARDEQFARRILYFSNFEDMLFQMNGLNVSNILGAGNEVVGQLTTFHRETFKYNALRMLGSSNLIGNPSKFVSGVGTGVTDFFVKPYQGMKDGSIVKAAGGFADGSKSLLKNAIMAPVGAVSKLTNSVSRGTLALSFDDKFVEEKQKQDKMNQPKNFGEGVAQGFSSAGESIWSGVTGVFQKPYQGAKEDGLGGFFKGIGKGAAGLVTKTASGVVDIVAKTTEGIENQTKNRVHVLMATMRIRKPRPFYETNNVLRPYDYLHSNWYYTLPLAVKEVDVRWLYELFVLPGTCRETTCKKGEVKVEEKTWTVMVITKLFLFEVEYWRSIPIDESAKRNLKEETTRTRSVYEQLEGGDVSEPSPINRLTKEGYGERITVNSVYLMKQLDFAEVIDDRALIMGFKTNQTENILSEKLPEGGTKTTLLVNKAGECIKYDVDKAPKVNNKQIQNVIDKNKAEFNQIVKKKALQKQTPEQMAKLRDKLEASYFAEKARSRRIAKTQHVLKDEYWMQLLFEDPYQAQQIKMSLDRIKKAHKREKLRANLQI